LRSEAIGGRRHLDSMARRAQCGSREIA
jgi:hypothetical protein